MHVLQADQNGALKCWAFRNCIWIQVVSQILSSELNGRRFLLLVCVEFKGIRNHVFCVMSYLPVNTGFLFSLNANKAARLSSVSTTIS